MKKSAKRRYASKFRRFLFFTRSFALWATLRSVFFPEIYETNLLVIFPAWVYVRTRADKLRIFLFITNNSVEADNSIDNSYSNSFGNENIKRFIKKSNYGV